MLSKQFFFRRTENISGKQVEITDIVRNQLVNPGEYGKRISHNWYITP